MEHDTQQPSGILHTLAKIAVIILLLEFVVKFVLPAFGIALMAAGGLITLIVLVVVALFLLRLIGNILLPVISISLITVAIVASAFLLISF